MSPSRRLLLCVAVALSLASLGYLARAGNASSQEELLEQQVRVQRLIADAKDYLLVENNPARAVDLLEKNLHLIDGNKAYLVLLRDAYKKHILNLFLNNQTAQAQKYLGRLRILDPQSADQIAQNPNSGLTKSSSPSVHTPVAVPVGAPVVPTAKGGDAGKPVFRGSMEDDFNDPFAVDNALGKDKKLIAAGSVARTLLTSAEKKFNQQYYHEAAVLFEQAYLSDKSVLDVPGTPDRWAYCRFKFVVDQLNQNPPGKPAAELEAQVKAALALKPSPAVSKIGQQLLEQLHQQTAAGKSVAQAATVVVKHLPKNTQGWQVAETKHFRVYHNQSAEFAEQVARVAEQTRVSMTAKWFGPGAKAWRDRCEIYLHATADDYNRKTGVHPKSPGHSRIEADSATGEVIRRQIELRCDNPDLLSAVLPHETTHVILAGQFGRYQVPRWVDEGMAVLTEPKSKVDLHLNNLPMHHDRQELFPVGDLLEMKDYPHASRVGAFYAQSVSLVRFLTELQTPQVFAQFVRDGMAKGYEPALRSHYGIKSYAELQARWQQQVLEGANVSAAQK